MAVIDLISTRLCPEKGSLSTIYSVVIKHLPCSNARICPKFGASLEQKLHKGRPFYTKCNGRPDGKHSHLVRSWQMAFESKPIPALPRCPSNKVNTSFLWVKGDSIFMKLDTPFSFVVFLGMLHQWLWGMPVHGRTVTRNLKWTLSSICWVHQEYRSSLDSAIHKFLWWIVTTNETYYFAPFAFKKLAWLFMLLY